MPIVLCSRSERSRVADAERDPFAEAGGVASEQGSFSNGQ